MRETTKKKQRNNQKGITLIALVITIIVLLILAGVAISMLAGDNGILKQAANAKETTEKQTELEKIKLATTAAMTNEEHKVNKGELDKELLKYGYPESTESNDKFKVVVGEKTYEIEKNGIVKETEKINIQIPSGFNLASDSGKTIEEGIVIEDSNGNQYVWIPVPKKTTEITWGVEYSPETTETSYEQIENALHTYTDYYRNGTSYKDEWYGKTTSSADTDTEGCGLSKSEYEENKKKMLSSIYENEGFYIGRYEAGIETNRTSHTSIADDLVPLSKEGKYPLTYVYCSEAQKLASRISVNGYTSSLMFGVQWDCVMVYLENCGWDSKATAQNALRSNSKTWGNYYDAEYTLNRGKYAQYNKLTDWKKFDVDLDEIVSSSHKSAQTSYSNGILYTTGAADQNSKCKIYDIAGNVYEWTLEKTSNTSYPCAYRGGNYSYNGSNCASYRNGNYTTYSNNNVGFRPALY